MSDPAQALRERIAAGIERHADRVQAGPRQRASWETPINTLEFDAGEKAAVVISLRALASGVRAGIVEEENDDA